MAANARKCTTQLHRSKHTVTGRSKKVAQSHASQISALTANNRQLATALDDLRQDYRKLQQENLQLKRERQALLEKVASLEKRAGRSSFSELLQEAQTKLYEVQSSLEFALKSSRVSPGCKPPIPSPSSKKVLRFSSPSAAKLCTIYPRTPYPLHNMTCVVDGPQLASTPVRTGQGSSSSPCLHLSPQKIDYSDSTSSATEPTGAGRRDRVCTGPKESGGTDISPIGELIQQQMGEAPAIIDQNSTLDQLEDALTCGHMSVSADRPRRKCVSLSQSYQEPTLKRKLRRGDPFTEQGTDWNPPDHKERRKKATKKSNTVIQRKVLCEVQNQL